MGTAFQQWRGVALFAVFFTTISANADWLDDYSRAVPWTGLFRHTHNGGWTSNGSLANRNIGDISDYFVARAELLGRTEAGNKALFDQYLTLPLRVKHGIFFHLDMNGHGTPILDYLAKNHFKQSPAGFVELLWSYKYVQGKRAPGGTAHNLLNALDPADRAKAIELLRKSAKAKDSVERGLAYTYDAPDWKRTAKDKTNFSYTLKGKTFKGEYGIAYNKLKRLSGDPRINDLDAEMASKYDSDSSGILSNIGSDKLGEVGEMEARGNFGRNDATLALLKFIIAEISHGSPEQGLGIYLTLHPFTKVALLKSIEPEFYTVPVALLLDATLDEMQNPENPQKFAVSTDKVGSIVASWIMDSGDPRYVARILPMMKNRAILLREIKAQNVDLTSENSPFKYVEPLAQQWGEYLFGKDFKLVDETPGDYAEVLQRWVDGKIGN